MNKFVMTVGLPASGKSKMASRYAEQGYVAHSSDIIREELFGDTKIQREPNKVFELLHKRVKEDLVTGYNVVYDATNISAKRRVQFLSELKSYDCHKKALVMATPYNTCVDNDRLRADSVGYQTVFKMFKNWQLPNYNEGWDEIELKYWYDIDYDFYFELDKKALKIDQCNIHHNMTIGNHMRFVAKQIFDSGEFDDKWNEILYNAALYHDLGKMVTQSFLNGRGKIAQGAHYYSHEGVSAYFAMFIFHDVVDVINICNVIQYHMKPMLLTSNKSIDKMKAIVGDEMWDNLVKFSNYDKMR